MRARTIAAVGVVAVVAITGCRTDRKVTEPEPVEVTQERLAAALIDERNLPEYQPVEESTPFNAEVVPEHECDDAIAELEPDESASADFVSGDRRVSHSVAWFDGGAGDAEQAFRTLLDDCDGVVSADEEAIRSEALNFGVLSDDSLPILVELEPPDGVIEERAVVVLRRDDLMSVIRMTGPRPTNTEVLDQATRAAIGYLDLLHDDTT